MLCNRDLLRNEEKSIHHLVAVCDKHPSYCYGHYLLGEEYLHRGDASSALQSFQNALREDDSDYRVWLGLGDCHLLRKDNRTAAAHYCQALTIFPSCSNAYCRLARAWIQAGNLENAHQTVNKGLSNDKNCMGVSAARLFDLVVAPQSGAIEEKQAIQEGDLLLWEGASAVQSRDLGVYWYGSVLSRNREYSWEQTNSLLSKQDRFIARTSDVFIETIRIRMASLMIQTTQK